MKKSLSEGSVAQNRPRTPKKQSKTLQKLGFRAPEQRSEDGTKGFFNRLEGFWYNENQRGTLRVTLLAEWRIHHLVSSLSASSSATPPGGIPST
ncbi:MAG: hypothetical protein LC751_17025, partial [Actinobacteria bacterium]|nr:hypothetical protein [Actinomycetota bacterium]